MTGPDPQLGRYTHPPAVVGMACRPFSGTALGQAKSNHLARRLGMTPRPRSSANDLLTQGYKRWETTPWCSSSTPHRTRLKWTLGRIAFFLALPPPHTTSFGPFLLRVCPNKSYAERPPPAPTLSWDRLGLEKGARLSSMGK